MTTSLTKSSDKYILSTTSTGTSAAPYPSAHTVIASTIFSAIESLDSVLSTQGAQRLEVRKNRERILKELEEEEERWDWEIERWPETVEEYMKMRRGKKDDFYSGNIGKEGEGGEVSHSLNFHLEKLRGKRGEDGGVSEEDGKLIADEVSEKLIITMSTRIITITMLTRIITNNHSFLSSDSTRACTKFPLLRGNRRAAALVAEVLILRRPVRRRNR